MTDSRETIEFWKMHGAGNDFVLVDDRERMFPCADSGWIAKIAARRTGIGCEGIILIQKSVEADFRMRFFNPDGNEVDMCGNGARCVARLAHDMGVASADMMIETGAGILGARCMDGAVRLVMSRPDGMALSCPLEVDGVHMLYGFVNTGVPHVVVEVESLSDINVLKMGSGIRYHEAFAPAGTNANFYTVRDDRTLSVRTYERGVEGETLACGTGIVASALVAARNGRVIPPVNVIAASGDTLVVDFRIDGDEVLNVTLLGPAEHVYKGVIDVGFGHRTSTSKT